MNFENPEVVELGLAEELIQDEFDQENTEGTMPTRIKLFSPVYIAEAE
jgi:hypothetical protein